MIRDRWRCWWHGPLAEARDENVGLAQDVLTLENALSEALHELTQAALAAHAVQGENTRLTAENALLMRVIHDLEVLAYGEKAS